MHASRVALADVVRQWAWQRARGHRACGRDTAVAAGKHAGMSMDDAGVRWHTGASAP